MTTHRAADTAPLYGGGPATPPLRRRFLSMTYEAMLLFALVFIAGYLFDTLTQSRDALRLRHVRQTWLFVVLGVYFVWFWTHGGQTLAMKTWHVRLVHASGAAVDVARGVVRYLLLWLFIVPTLAVVGFAGVGGWAATVAMSLAILLPPFYALFDRDGQFLHDRLAGTRIVAVEGSGA